MLIYVALAISIVVMGLGALTIDIGNGRQQQRFAQSVADAAALSGAQGLTEPLTSCGSAWYSPSEGCAYFAGFFYALGSLSSNSSRPTPGALLTCGANCQAYTTGGKTIVVSTNWQGNPQWVHVRVCLNTPTAFGKVVGVRSLAACAQATGLNASFGTSSGANVGQGTGGNPSSCTTNDLSTTIDNPITPGGAGALVGTVLSATYNAALPIDPNSIVFIGPDVGGNLVKLSEGAGGYSLTPVSGNTMTISYALPGGLTTATASLFVADINGSSCGQLAWSSCPVSTHDNFIETDGNGNGIADHGMQGTDSDLDETQTATQLANSALIADADDSVVPPPGQTVGPGATLGATYHDETDINQSNSVLFLNGIKAPATFAQISSGGGGDNAYRYNLSYGLPANTPSGWNSALLYFWDLDVNQTGGDCALTQWTFKFAGGQGGIVLVQ